MKNPFMSVVLLCTIAFGCLPLKAESQAEIPDLNEAIDSARSELDMQAATAVIVIKDGRIVHEAYFGYSDVEHGKLADDDTLFYIASTTKAYLATAVLHAIAQGELTQETTLAELFPDLKFPYFDASLVTVRHLLTHTHGLENDHMTFAGSYTGLNGADIRLAMTRATYPSSDGGLGEFEYTNLGYNLMSIWLERHYGKDWRHSLRDLLLDPLGLERSTGFMSLAQGNGWDVARPYDYRQGEGREAVYLQKTDSTMHAVGLVSPTREVARFLLAHLNEGQLEGGQLLPAKVIEQSRVKQVATNGPFFDGYAWGWFTKQYEGRDVVFHTGGFVGASALLAMIPDEEIGIIVLQNESGLRANMVSSFVEQLVYDKLLGADHPEAGSTAVSEQIDSMTEILVSAKERNWDRTRVLAERPSRLSAALSSYEGIYGHPLSGTISVKVHGNTLLFTWGNLRGFAYPGEEEDTVEVRFRPGNLETVSFTTEEGKVTGVNARGFRFEAE